MNMKTKMKYIAACAAALAFFSCDLKPHDTGSRGIIQLGADSRAAGARFAVDTTEAETQLRYEITFSGPEETRIIEIPAGSALRCKVEVIPGDWTVTIRASGPPPAVYTPAYFPAEMLRAWGTTSVRVQAGQTSPATVTLRTATEVSDINQLNEAITNISAREELIFVTADIATPALTMTAPALSGKSISIQGIGSPTPEISLTGTGSLFTVGDTTTPNITLTLGNITLRGVASNNNSLLWIDGGHLVMNTGATVTGNGLTTSSIFPTVAPHGGGITIAGAGTFIMNGGEIWNNSFTSHTHDYNGAGGVGIRDDSSFTMNGGIIRNNTGTSAHSNGVAGGISGGGGGNNIFFMNNGEIKDNTASGTWFQCGIAGGVVADIMEMHGGTISGNQGTSSASSGGTGGGIYVEISFLMTGGEISSNIATHTGTLAGGGIRVIGTATLQKLSTGGTISGADAPTTLQNTANGSGNAASIGPWTSITERRTNTVAPTDAMDSTIPGPPGGWD